MTKRKYRRPSPSFYTQLDLPSTLGSVGAYLRDIPGIVRGGWKKYKQQQRLHKEGKGDYVCPHCRLENKEVILQGRDAFLDHITTHRIRKALNDGNMPEVQLQGDKM